MAVEAVIKVKDWLDDDNLLLISGWSRDGYGYEDIANRIGIAANTFNGWRRKYPEFNEAMKAGREIVDYKVENALLKSALGYTATEVKVTTIMRYGKIVETQKEVTEREQAPNIAAIQTWLYNRLPDKWNRRQGNLSADLEDDDSSIHIEVVRASDREEDDNSTIVEEHSKDEVTGVDGSKAVVSNGKKKSSDSTNKSVTLRKATKEEQSKNKAKKDSSVKKHDKSTEVVEDEDDVDYWPDDWEDQ